MSDTIPPVPPPPTEEDLKEATQLLCECCMGKKSWCKEPMDHCRTGITGIAAALRARERKGHAEGYALGYHDGKGPKPIHPELEQSCRDTAQRDEYEEGLRERGE